MTSASSTHSRERHILLGVTGSIAAFKAAQLASDWVKQGHQVRVLMTTAAAQFVSPLTFQSLTHQSVRTAMFDDSGASQTATDDGMHVGITHIDDAKWADVFVIAPASADVIARIAAGMANDHLTATLLAATCPVVLAPAMNTRMYDNPVTQRNMTTCRQLGMSFVEPSSGLLACEDVGKGRLAELSDIEWAVDEALEGMSAPRFDADVAGPGRSGAARAEAPRPTSDVESAGAAPSDAGSSDAGPIDAAVIDAAMADAEPSTTLVVPDPVTSDVVVPDAGAMPPLRAGGPAGGAEGLLSGVRVLITAGPTREPIDPVRFLSNHSSGRMGYALASAAHDLGAAVTLVSGPVSLPEPAGVTMVQVQTAAEMFDAVTARFEQADLVVMAAAVADFAVAAQADQKIKKRGRRALTLQLEATPDILAWCGEHRHPGQVLCGFAMETTELVAHATEKLARKGADMIVANSLTTPGAGFGTDTNVVTILTATDGEPHRDDLPMMTKRELAGQILARMAALRVSA
ncbi:Hypothetical protein PFCIRM508_07600 [Propionibacterium freudenreichii]|uniref:bifunctional phosphopantothenoylcysteine decarboxylase/phosphopantothenate synthase n=1 Tax=Propionibacterium freudenreichii TaxID=1744 RepID=UPI0005420AFD|nr:bifunctional phosphopantothenoylcysteine decarboxylase/phosphopantothenate synthase [Propionibacterium freudenreichii]CEG86379.1 Hypothetical protein PFCIRM118_10150 [Propionibacterium freudenreichii]CEI26754.1 Hypothetical protein PFCIRM508_07600 [Propionibacterium freudenreichii]SCQ64638.1 Hypothetical protein PFR_JS9-1_2260 [Propionibacterium freudenreichii]SCQ71247.1 Hypothetical protein PFR_JS9-2_2256 [Propionibacterium freudenreichii]SCQ77071.1 Hypothetical protein PFR_JS20-1_2218 [Pr